MSINSITKIAAWKTTDGKTHEDLEVAKKHQAKLNVNTWAQSVGLGSGGEWDKDMIVDTLIDHANTVSRLLQPMIDVIEQRPNATALQPTET